MTEWSVWIFWKVWMYVPDSDKFLDSLEFLEIERLQCLNGFDLMYQLVQSKWLIRQTGVSG